MQQLSITRKNIRKNQSHYDIAYSHVDVDKIVAKVIIRSFWMMQCAQTRVGMAYTSATSPIGLKAQKSWNSAAATG
jgi:hypothetical protein